MLFLSFPTWWFTCLFLFSCSIVLYERNVCFKESIITYYGHKVFFLFLFFPSVSSIICNIFYMLCPEDLSVCSWLLKLIMWTMVLSHKEIVKSSDALPVVTFFVNTNHCFSNFFPQWIQGRIYAHFSLFLQSYKVWFTECKNSNQQITFFLFFLLYTLSCSVFRAGCCFH